MLNKRDKGWELTLREGQSIPDHLNDLKSVTVVFATGSEASGDAQAIARGFFENFIKKGLCC